MLIDNVWLDHVSRIYDTGSGLLHSEYNMSV